MCSIHCTVRYFNKTLSSLIPRPLHFDSPGVINPILSSLFKQRTHTEEDSYRIVALNKKIKKVQQDFFLCLYCSSLLR